MHATFHLLPAALIVSLAAAFQLPDLQPFIQALPNLLQEYIPPLQNETATHDLLKRQESNACPKHFRSCANLGAPSLCCMSKAVCSADYAGHVACCPSGAACTGTIGGVITAGNLNGNGVLVGEATGTPSIPSGGAAATPTITQMYTSTVSNGLVVVTSPPILTTENGGQTNDGFVIAGSSTVATPGAAVRGAQIPYAAQWILMVLADLPL